MTGQTEKQWYWIAKNGRRIGPDDPRYGMRSAAARGDLLPTTLVWSTGQADWLPADQTDLRSLFDGIELPPPLPHERPMPCGPVDDDVPADNADQPIESRPKALGQMRDEVGPKGRLVIRLMLLATVPALWALATYAYLNPDAFPGGHPREWATWAGLVGATLLAIVAFAMIRKPEPRSAVMKVRNGARIRRWQVVVGVLGAALLVIASATMAWKRAQQGGDQSAQENAAVEACRWRWNGSGGGVRETYDWDRGYLRDVNNETNAPMPTRIDGQPIKCVLIPKHGVDISFQNCGIYTSWPDDHLVCWMIYDASRDLWVNTDDIR